MKLVDAAALLLCMVLFALPARAQEQPAAGPLMRAVHKEASRLAADARPRTANAHQGSSWSRLSGLAPGTEILVEIRGGPAASQYFVAASDFELIVLNLADPPLTRKVRRVLRGIASTHPEYLVRICTGSPFVRDNVRVGSDGVFVADRKVAECSDVVKRVPRPEVVAITTTSQHRGSLVGAVIGAGGGLLLGYVSALHLAYKQCHGSCDEEKALMTLSLVGMPIAGGMLGYQADTRTTQDVIYRALASRDSR